MTDGRINNNSKNSMNQNHTKFIHTNNQELMNLSSKDMISSIADIVNEIILTNNQLIKNQNFVIQDCSAFYSPLKPTVSIKLFLKRITKFLKPDNSTYVLALIYIDKICDKKSFVITENNIFKLLFSSIMTAFKFNEDIFYNNAYFSKVGGMNQTDINILEHDFLELINYELVVDMTKFFKYVDCLLKINQMKNIKTNSNSYSKINDNDNIKINNGESIGEENNDTINSNINSNNSNIKNTTKSTAAISNATLSNNANSANCTSTNSNEDIITNNTANKKIISRLPSKSLKSEKSKVSTEISEADLIATCKKSKNYSKNKYSNNEDEENDLHIPYSTCRNKTTYNRISLSKDKSGYFNTDKCSDNEGFFSANDSIYNSDDSSSLENLEDDIIKSNNDTNKDKIEDSIANDINTIDTINPLASSFPFEKFDKK